MNIPDDDSDILGTTSDEVTRDLLSRDFIIKHRLIPELTSSVPSDNLFKEMRVSVDHYISSSTPWTRVRALFSFDPVTAECELQKTAMRALYVPAILSGCVGLVTACFRMLTAYDEFIRSHRLTTWRTPQMAKRMAADYVTLKASMMFITIGCRTFLLATGCYAFPLILSAMQGYSSFWEYAAGWGLSCSLFCLTRGHRQAMTAGLIAAVPGLLYGTVNLHLMRKLGLTFEDMYRAQIEQSFKLRCQTLQ